MDARKPDIVRHCIGLCKPHSLSLLSPPLLCVDVMKPVYIGDVN